WHELVKKFITVAIELCILDDQNRVFLVYRKDKEYDGYHMPGTVVNDWEGVLDAKKRLVEGEVAIQGLTITDPQPIGWLEVQRGNGPHTDHSRHGLSLLHVAHFSSTFVPKNGAGFYSFDALPKNTLISHRYLLKIYMKYVEDGKIVLGENIDSSPLKS
ncbi:MAG: NUDIX domain-containing protein, partial [Bacteroidota bacterium]|nr:NUDIX domain-containing protein [Bacteroidota bacterium]